MGIRKKNSKETFTRGLTKALGELFSCSALRPGDTMEDLAHISLLTQEKQFKHRVMIPGLSLPNKTECPDTGLFIHFLWGPPRNSFSNLPLLPARSPGSRCPSQPCPLSRSHQAGLRGPSPVGGWASVDPHLQQFLAEGSH